MPSSTHPLSLSAINTALAHPQVMVMNFLNEVATRHPNAISFASGRPPEEFYDVEASLGHVRGWVEAGLSVGGNLRDAYQSLVQYGRTAGLIQHQIARLLYNDNGVKVNGEEVLVTTGAQEGMGITLLTLCANPGDVALVAEPAYVGMSAAARVLGILLEPAMTDDHGIDVDALARTCDRLRSEGKRARLLYLSPDFANPTGVCMPSVRRHQLLDAAAHHGLVLVEDHAYHYFRYEGEAQPPLLAMAQDAPVILLGSFSKSIFPGVRLGYAATHLRVTREGYEAPLVDEMTKVKSLLTVNTSPLCQAIVGGLLQANGGSLKKHVAPLLALLRERRAAMLAALECYFPADAPWAHGVSWNRPAGGFFLTLRLPFEVDDHDLDTSAREHHVIWTPMSYFNIGPARRDTIRLSFSCNTPTHINEGVRRLAGMVRSRAKATASTMAAAHFPA